MLNDNKNQSCLKKRCFCLVNCLFFLRNKIKRVHSEDIIITVIRTISTGYGILLQVEYYILHHAIFFILFLFFASFLTLQKQNIAVPSSYPLMFLLFPF